MRTSSVSSRTTRYRRHWPRVVAWSIGLAAAIALIAVAAVLLGVKPDDDPDNLGEALVKAGHTSAVALAIACSGLLHAVWCVRHLILHQRAWNGGPIEVHTFTEDTPLTVASADQLTVDFRQRLMRLHLQAPTPVPGAAPQRDMLDVLESGSIDAKNPFSWLVGLLRAAIPSHAYEVRGSLRERETAPRCGVTVQVISLTAESLPPATFWGHTWDEALSLAADEATAAILPQTRRCSAPWGVWRGYTMPRGLLHAYESGARLEHDRRYDEALAAYWRAVELDPMNMVLRLRVGQLQERLGLYLDALATFWGMRVASKHADCHPRHGRAERDEALTSARYRRNVLLGGRVLATQWCAPAGEPGSTLRDQQRARLRTVLRPRLAPKLNGTDEALAEPGAEFDRDQFLALRALFAQHALDDCAKLRSELEPGSRLTHATLRLTELCIGVRLSWVRHHIDAPGTPWFPPDVAAGIAKIEGSHRSAFGEWHEQYNAACAWALALADDTVRASYHADEYANRAVERLERATACADSAYIASRRDWVVSEDPDLGALRARQEFKEFELLYLPADGFTPGRPQNVLQIESSRYVRDLLAAVAARWQATWRERRADAVAEIDGALVRCWFEEERQIWTRVNDVAVNFRHPKTRASLIEAQRACGHAVEVGFPQYEREPLCRACGDKALDEAAGDVVEAANRRLKLLTDALAPMLKDLDGWACDLQDRSAAARPMSPHVLRQRCARHIALWQRLGEWLAADDAETLTDGRAHMLAAAQALRLAPDPPQNGNRSVRQFDRSDRDLARRA
jgi:hypothetical protein